MVLIGTNCTALKTGESDSYNMGHCLIVQNFVIHPSASSAAAGEALASHDWLIASLRFRAAVPLQYGLVLPACYSTETLYFSP